MSKHLSTEKAGAGQQTAQIIDMEEAQNIANEIGYRGDIQADVVQANSYGKTYGERERLLRGYFAEYVAERNSDNAMLARTGYGEIE